MGVRGLYTYFCNYVHHGILNVDMKSEVEDYKRRNCGKKPIIIIDGYTLDPYGYASSHEFILGGRHEIYSEKCREMLNCLKSLDAELIFYFDGPFQAEKLDARLKSRNNTYMNEFEILQDIDSDLDISMRFNYMDLTNPAAIQHNLLELLVNYFSVPKMSCLNELDQEVVQFANRIKAFAIITWDSDYLIFSGKWRYWSARDIDFKKRTTLEYNKRAMRLQLGLSEDQMALFDTLGGNDFLPYERVQQFHRNITRVRENKFNAIASYVRRFKSHPPHLSDTDLEKIYNDLFGKDRERGVLEFQSSLNFYFMKNMKFKYNNPILERTTKDIDKFPFKILNKNEDTVSIYYRNLLKNEFTGYEIIIDLIQRMMGVLLFAQKNSSEDVKRIMYFKKSHEVPYEPVVLMPIFPQVELPSILELLYHPYGENQELDNLRWDLLCFFISPKLERELLLKIPKTNLVEILSIFILVEKNQIEINEADSLLLACNCSTIIRNKLQFGEVNKVKSRDVELSYLFQKIFSTLKSGFVTVGLRNFSDLLKFDGLYFHILRKQWASGNHELNEIAIERFKDIRIYSPEFGLL